MRVVPHHVVSSNLSAVGYQRGKLFVRFNNGACYEYEGGFTSRLPSPDRRGKRRQVFQSACSEVVQICEAGGGSFRGRRQGLGDRMRYAVAHTGREWEITGVCGPFAGVVVATADGITLERAQFSALGRIFGTPASVWGCVLQPEIDWARGMLFELGVNRPFDMRPHREAHFDGDQFLDYHTNQVLGEVEAITLFFNSIRYRR